jgi:hypothetical protein
MTPEMEATVLQAIQEYHLRVLLHERFATSRTPLSPPLLALLALEPAQLLAHPWDPWGLLAGASPEWLGARLSVKRSSTPPKTFSE